jgi:hypothetical protein
MERKKWLNRKQPAATFIVFHIVALGIYLRGTIRVTNTKKVTLAAVGKYLQVFDGISEGKTKEGK